MIVVFASERNLPAAVRSGVHDLSGRCLMDDAISIDLTQMNTVVVDPDAKTVKAQAGPIWRNFTADVQQIGLATGGPMDSSVTVSGYGLGGGLNLLMRKHGLGCDNVVSIDMVTADAKQTTVSENENEDLFWAIRGAGANSGVVTSISPSCMILRRFLQVVSLGHSPSPRCDGSQC